MEVSKFSFEGCKAIYADPVGSKNFALTSNTEAHPVYLQVDTGVDYAAIFTGTLGFLVAALAAWFTLSVQKNQIQSNVSNLRHHWMGELRVCGSELLQNLALLIQNIKTKENYRKSEDYVSLYTKIIVLQSKLELLMSREDEPSKRLRKKVAEILLQIKDLKFENINQAVFKSLSELKNLIRAELEQAWIDVKDDLGINRKFFGFRFVSRSNARQKG